MFSEFSKFLRETKIPIKVFTIVECKAANDFYTFGDNEFTSEATVAKYAVVIIYAFIISNIYFSRPFICEVPMYLSVDGKDKEPVSDLHPQNAPV